MSLAPAPPPSPPSPVERGKITRLPFLSPLPYAAASREKRRSSLAFISFLLVVALPTLLAAIYLFAIAADQYVVEFRIAVRSVEPVRSDAPTLLRGSVAAAQLGLDSNIVTQYIESRAIVDDIGKSLDLRRIFSRRRADWLARLEPAVPVENLVRYWKGQVDAFFDTGDGTITVKVRAFTPADALTIARAVVKSSEILVNTLSERARRDTLRQSEEEVRQAEARLAAALAKLREFRDEKGVLDPKETADRTLSLAAKVRAARLSAEAELTTLKKYLRDDTPAVRLVKARIAALAAQQRTLDAELTAADAPGAPALSAVMGSYDQLEAERSFAETAYRHALSALDRSRADAERRQIYLADFVPPSLPQEALYPRRWRSLGVVLLIAFALWAVGGLAVQSVRDHL
jgi:capsular polysaccharide transport system permease protein